MVFLRSTAIGAFGTRQLIGPFPNRKAALDFWDKYPKAFREGEQAMVDIMDPEIAAEVYA